MDLFVTYGTTKSVPQGLEWKDHAVLVGKIEKVKRFAVVIEMGRGKGRKLLSGRQQAMPTTGKPSFTVCFGRTAKAVCRAFSIKAHDKSHTVAFCMVKSLCRAPFSKLHG
jgi:hypothetical protein